jgi:PASTA domain
MVAEVGEAVVPGAVGLTFGGLFLLIAIVGGGFTAKELTVPKVPTWARAVSAIVGGFLLAGPYVYSLVAGQGGSTGQQAGPTGQQAGPIGPSGHQCRSPHEVPLVTEGEHSEADVKQLLQARGLFNIVVEPDVTHPGTPNGIVVGQKPAPGTIICPRDLVTIIVAK